MEKLICVVVEGGKSQFSVLESEDPQMDNEGPGQTNSVSYNGDLQTYLMFISPQPPQKMVRLSIYACVFMPIYIYRF